MAALLDVLQLVVVENHSIAPKSGIQPGEEKLAKHYYKPSLFPLDSHIWKSNEANAYV